MGKLNFWQWLGIVLLVIGVTAWIIRERKEKQDPQPQPPPAKVTPAAPPPSTGPTTGPATQAAG